MRLPFITITITITILHLAKAYPFHSKYRERYVSSGKPLERTANAEPSPELLFVPEIDTLSLYHTKSMAEIAKFDRRLTAFTKDLRSFVTKDGFQFLAFDSEPYLDTNVVIIESSYKALEWVPPLLESKYKFAKSLLRTMEDTCSHIISAVPSDDPFHDIIVEIFQIRLSIMMMLDDVGRPDTNIDFYAEKVAFFDNKVRKFGDENYRILSKSSSSVLSLVWSQFNKVEMILKRLKSALAPQES